MSDNSPDDSIFGALSGNGGSVWDNLTGFGEKVFGAVTTIGGAVVDKSIENFLNSDKTDGRQEINTQNPQQQSERAFMAGNIDVFGVQVNKALLMGAGALLALALVLKAVK